MAALGCVQAVERFLEVVTDPQRAVFFLLQVQRLEESLVQPAALLSVATLVERLGVFEELQAQLDDLPGQAEVLVGIAESGGQSFALPGDVVQAGPDLVLGKRAIGCQVDEVGLLGVERTKLFGELGMEELGGRLLFIEQSSEVSAHGSGELGSEADRGVVNLDGFLDTTERCVRQFAGVVVPSGAEEVAVDVAIPVGGMLDDHAAAVAAHTVAGAAEQRAFELVVVNASQFLSLGPGVGDVLDTVEEVFGDEGLMTSLVLLTVVGDPAAVVVIAQDDSEAVGRDAALGVLGVTGHAQPALVQFVGQVGVRVLASGVQLEAETDEGAAYRVDDDGADLAVLDVLDGVEVADWGAGDRATVLGLLPHLVLDVIATLGRGVLVDDGEHAVQHPASRGVVDVLLDGRDKPDTELLQRCDHDRVVQAVSGEATEHVDDHVAHVGVFAQVGDHLLELGALVDGAGAAAGVDELCGLHRIQFAPTFFDLLPLGGDRHAFGIVVGVDLSLGRDTQVSDVIIAGDALQNFLLLFHAVLFFLSCLFGFWAVPV